MKSIADRHETDMATLEGLTGNAENIDTTEAIAKLQSVQTQMTASYEITRIVSQLSLVNFL